MAHLTIMHLNDQTIALEAPFYEEANTDYRNIGGSWKGDKRHWEFDARDIDRLRAVLKKHFGHDDRPYEKADILLKLDCTILQDEFWAFGRLIFKRWNRDQQLSRGPGVIVVDGTLPATGGSVKYPAVGTFNNVVIEIRDVPADHPDLDDEDVTILRKEATAPVIDTEYTALLADLDQMVMDVDPVITDLAARIASERGAGVEEHQILKAAMQEMHDNDTQLSRNVLCVLVVLATRRLPEAKPPMPEWKD